MSTATRPLTFVGFPFRSAVFAAPAVNGGPFNSSPFLSPVIVYGSDVSREDAASKGELLFTSGNHTATAADMEGDGRFWLCYSEDCFSPPMFIVRADNESDAVDALLDTFPAQFTMSAEDEAEREADGHPETVGYAGNGSVPYDTETLRIRELRLVSVQFS